MKTKGFNTMDNDDTDPEWERIKQWLGVTDTVDKHPVQEHFEREAQKKPQNMDEGGIAGDDPLKVGPVGPGGPLMGAPVDPSQLPGGAMPQAQPPVPQVPAMPPAAPTQPTADSVLGTNPQELRDYLTKVNHVGLGERVGTGLSGLADAFSRAGRSNSNYQEQFTNRMKGQREAAAAIPGQVANLGKEKFGVQQTLDEQNPNSELSKYAQQNYGSLGKKLGIDLSHASAKMISDLVGKTVQELESERTADLAKQVHEQTAAYQGQMLKNTAEHQHEETIQGAAKGLESRGIGEKIRDFFSPSEETKALQKQAAGMGSANSTSGNVDHGAALQWAQSHPNDPRSAIIIQRAKQGLNAR